MKTRILALIFLLSCCTFIIAVEVPPVLEFPQEGMDDPAKYQSYRREGWIRAQTLHWDAILPQACDWLEAQARGIAGPIPPTEANEEVD